MPALKRYAPLVGTAVLAAIVILRLLGLHEAAATIETVGGWVNLPQQSPVGIGELTAAGAAITGIVLKIRAEIRKLRAQKAP